MPIIDIATGQPLEDGEHVDVFAEFVAKMVEFTYVVHERDEAAIAAMQAVQKQMDVMQQMQSMRYSCLLERHDILEERIRELERPFWRRWFT